MFSGKHKGILLPGNKIQLPEEFRSEFEDGIAVIQKENGYLSITAKAYYKQIEQRIKDSFDQLRENDHFPFKRFQIPEVDEVRISLIGEIELSKNLLKYAKIEKEIIFIGKKNRFWIGIESIN